MKDEQHTGKIRLKPYNSNELLPYVISCKKERAQQSLERDLYLSKWWSLCPWRLSTGRNHGGNLGLQFWHLVFIQKEGLSRSKADL